LAIRTELGSGNTRPNVVILCNLNHGEYGHKGYDVLYALQNIIELGFAVLLLQDVLSP